MLLVVCFLAGIAVSAACGASNLPPRSIIGAVVSPFQSAGSFLKNKFSDLKHTFIDYDDLKKENELLKKEISDLKSENDSLYYLSYENEQLRKLFDFSKTHSEFKYAEADVIARSTDGWSSKLTLNRGTVAGISVNDSVITGEGLVGIVTDTGLNWSEVTCLTDPSVSVGAIAARTKDVGVTEGTVEMMRKNTVCMRYLDAYSSVKRGDTVLTSGVGSLYPEGIPLGTVTDISSDSGGMSISVTLDPIVKPAAVRTVFVIINFEQKENTDESKN